MRSPRLATLLVSILAIGCDPAPSPSPSPAPIPAPTERPSFEPPGSPSGLAPDEIRAEIEPLQGDAVISVGEGADGVVTIGLRANAEEVARELHAKYGEAVALSVGLFPFPPPDGAQRTCQQQRPTVAGNPPLVVTLSLPPTVVAGDFFGGKVRFTNAGIAPYELVTSSSFNVALFREGDPNPVGTSEGGGVGTGWSETLGPGQATELDAGGGTASCDLALGYMLPPGRYAARALIDVQDPETFELRFFWSDATIVEVLGS